MKESSVSSSQTDTEISIKTKSSINVPIPENGSKNATIKGKHWYIQYHNMYIASILFSMSMFIIALIYTILKKVITGINHEMSHPFMLWLITASIPLIISTLFGIIIGLYNHFCNTPIWPKSVKFSNNPIKLLYACATPHMHFLLGISLAFTGITILIIGISKLVISLFKQNSNLTINFLLTSCVFILLLSSCFILLDIGQVATEAPYKIKQHINYANNAVSYSCFMLSLLTCYDLFFAYKTSSMIIPVPQLSTGYDVLLEIILTTCLTIILITNFLLFVTSLTYKHPKESQILSTQNKTPYNEIQEILLIPLCTTQQVGLMTNNLEQTDLNK